MFSFESPHKVKRAMEKKKEREGVKEEQAREAKIEREVMRRGEREKESSTCNVHQCRGDNRKELTSFPDRTHQKDLAAEEASAGSPKTPKFKKKKKKKLTPKPHHSQAKEKLAK